MDLFRHKKAATDSEAMTGADVDWSLGKGEVNGRPLIERWDNAAKRNCPDRSRPVKVTIGIQCANTRPDGLPAGDDLDHLEAMEEAMFVELPALAQTQPVLVLTTNDMREWIIYAGTHEWLESWAPTFQERFMTGRPGKAEAVREPGWETFKEWTVS